MIALFIMFILFAIALTFFTVSRIQFQTATNVGNTVRAELLSEAATSLAINMLKKDAIEHPNVTSTDHAWTTYFNGLWAAEKDWMRPPWQPNVANGGIPSVFYDNYTYVDPRSGQIYYAPGVSDGAGELMKHLYVPRFERPKTGNLTGFIDNPETDYDRLANRFVFDPAFEPLTYAQRVGIYCDVDNDGDGKNDSIWVPLAQDYLFQKDEGVFGPADVDFNLDGKAGEDRAAILFYPGTYEPRNGVDAWYLTAPIDVPDFSYPEPRFKPLDLYNLSIPRLPASVTCSATASVADVVGGRYLVDAIDNDYDGIINYHVEYYAYTDPARDQTLTPEDRRRRIVTYAEFRRLIALGFTEISQQYLDPTLGLRICTTGEPMCELAGRAAILIRDEASKVNMNAAGAHYLDVPSFIDAGIDPLTLAASNTGAFTPFWRPAFASGASTGEYLTWVLPRLSEARSLKFWNLLTGAPNGSMRIGDDLSGIMPTEFVYDVTLPGYGFVDDNANALLLAINGIDDNGNGLIDEGSNPGINLTPDQIDAAWAYANRAGWFTAGETSLLYVNPAQSATDIAQAVYAVFANAGILEGVDEPAEFQYNYPVRNKIAEQIDNAPIGTFSDRPLPTRDYLKRAVLNEEIASGVEGLANGAINRMRPFITIDSGARNNRTIRDEDGNIETLGPKLNYNLASAAQMARAFIEEWKLDEALVYHGEDEDGNPLNPYVQLGYRYLPEDVNRYLSGEMRPDEQEVFPFNAFLAGMRIEGVQQTLLGAQTWLPGSPTAPVFPQDARLQAMQLAANIADAADGDHARTELSTADLQQFEYDPWWYALQVTAGTPPEEAKRPISYTVAGAEAIRINEIMVRPVRRIEAEILWYPDTSTMHDFYDPNLIFGTGIGYHVERASFANPGVVVAGVITYQYGLTIPATDTWDLVADITRLPYGCIGDKAELESFNNRVNVTLVPPEDPPVSADLPNVIEYRIGPSSHLPPGRYYLTINTTDDSGTPTVTAANQMKYLIKYARLGDPPATIPEWLTIRPQAGSLDNITVDTTGYWITQDLVKSAFGLTPAPVESWFSDVYINTGIKPEGWVFLDGEHPGNNFPDGDPTDDDPADPWVQGYLRGFQGYTVTVPRYADAAAGESQVYLHVAIWMTEATPDANFSINFFDFSQEPDHEWVEIENVSGQPIDLSGWQLTVGSPDSGGNISSGDKAEMEVPAGTVIDSIPPYNRLLLAVSAYSPPIPEDTVPETTFADMFNDNPFLWNGIGQVGTPGYRPVLDLDAGDTTVPLIPARLDTGPGPDGRGEIDPTVPPSPFEANDARMRVVQLKVSGLNANLLPITDIKQFMADWVLGGGVFPNYPEHDGIDNDYDDHLIGLNNPPFIMGRDGIDHNGDDDATGAGEGVDEGRLWMDSPFQIHAGAGSFNILPFALLYDLMPSLYPDDFFLTPEWKEFIERRFSPGDNVFVSLYQGPHQQKRVVDRITYTERDVINRCIDDDVPTIDENGIPFRPSLHDQSGAFTEAYKTFWPDNTMGLDFYRSLERKHHPLYNGDRFGTQNRWQATDGNYDDWAHEPVIDPAKWHGSPLDRNDAAFSLDEYGLLQQLALVDIRNTSFDSLGDLLSLEYCTLNKGYNTYGAVPLSANTLASFQPADATAGNIQSLMEVAVTDAIYLSPGAGFFKSAYPASPTPGQLACNYSAPCAVVDPQRVLPQAWRPFYLYEIYSAANSEPPPPGLPADGNYWLFNGPGEQRAAGLEDPEVLRSRWPVEKRAVLFASRNLDNTTLGNATVYVEWDASSGLQDGTYDLYVDTGLKLLDVSPDALTDTGKFIQCRAMENVTEQSAMNITVYTDTNGDGAITTMKQDTNSKDSLGRLTTLRPDSRGYIYCGSISVNNNRLAVEVENAVQPPAPGVTTDTLNTFAGLILTPRARTQGRINVNTVETRLYKDYDQNGNDIWRQLNVLAGIPGVFQDYPEWFAGEPAYTFSVQVDVADIAAYEFGVIVRCTGDSFYLLRIEKRDTTEPVATLYRVVDGVMQLLRSEVFTHADQFPVFVSVDAPYGPPLIGCTVNGMSVAWEDSIYPLLAGTVGLISTMPEVGFLNPTFSPVPGVTFSRGWSGIGWTIEDGLYRYGGRSTSSLFTGYGASDQLDNDYYTTPPQVIPPDNIQRPPFVRAEWLAKSRALPENWDGRYFSSISELIEQYPPAPEDPTVQDAVPFYSPLVFNNDPNDPGENLPLSPYLRGVALEESAWRLSRSANLLTTRSDIFEILVTVQAGTGEDLDGDGVINYRSNEEFTVTSERNTRTVYERP
ncbi:MAG TPA: hypothetical protein VMZ06_06310 [Candidatus Bathyarchaeia archaeon]|nr:hypothetical protein [Candidatus Bathyarchaeia archaeon]